MAAERPHNAETELTPGAAVLAWLWPGAGHISLGQRKRGLYIMAGVLLLFVSGLLIGGVNVVDRKDDRLWFIAQVFTGPVALAADYTNQRFIKTLPPEQLYAAQSISHLNEIGKLYCALAGLMNLVAILDALHFTPRRPVPSNNRQRRSSDQPGDAGAAGSGDAAGHGEASP